MTKKSAEVVPSGFTIQEFDDVSLAKQYWISTRLHEAFAQGMSPFSETGSASSLGHGLKADIRDLARVHWLVLQSKPKAVLELGSGLSTAIILHALDALAATPGTVGQDERVSHRVGNLHFLYSLEQSWRFLFRTRNLVAPQLRARLQLRHSTARFYLRCGQIICGYSVIPDENFDFIYVDGPAPGFTRGRVRGVSGLKGLRAPVTDEPLLLEPYFEPGAMILLDGRRTNAYFYRARFTRNWKEFCSEEGDVSIFELQEEPIGADNKSWLSLRQNRFIIP